MPRNRERCPNYNHGRKDAPVRFCTMCGETVNERVASKSCSEQAHAVMRRNRNHYCVDCGEELIKSR